MAAIPIALALSIAASVAPKAPDTIVAFACKESGNPPQCSVLDPLAIHDNTTGASHHPDNVREAILLANTLIVRKGHSVDLGIMQVNFVGPEREGLTIAEAFQPKRSMQTGAAILSDAYRICRTSYQQARSALRCAASRYNAGRESPVGRAYAASLFKVASEPSFPSIKEVITRDFIEAAPATTRDDARHITSSITPASSAGIYARPARSGRNLVFSTER